MVKVLVALQISLPLELFLVFIGLMALNIGLTIAYAIYLIQEEKRLLGTVSTRRLLESSITIVGALETGIWFFMIALVWFLPYLLGLSIAMGIGGLIAYMHSHGLPSHVVEAYALIATPLLLYTGYALYGLPGLLAFLTIVITSFVIASLLIELLSR